MLISTMHVHALTLQVDHIKCAVLRDMVYVILMPADNLSSPELHYASSSDLRHWRRLPSVLPTRDCALTTYHSQLVLVGGVDTDTGEVTNKLLWTSDTGHHWQPSLPPMPTSCRNPSVVNTVSPEYLVVGFWRKVMMLIGKQWTTVEHPMGNLRDITLHNGRFYFGTIHHCDVKLLIASCTQPRTDQPPNSASLWSEIPSPRIGYLASFGQQLVTLYWSDIRAYSPITQSWIRVSKGMPGVIGVCPTGDLLVFGHRGKTEVFKVSLKGEF